MHTNASYIPQTVNSLYLFDSVPSSCLFVQPNVDEATKIERIWEYLASNAFGFGDGVHSIWTHRIDYLSSALMLRNRLHSEWIMDKTVEVTMSQKFSAPRIPVRATWTGLAKPFIGPRTGADSSLTMCLHYFWLAGLKQTGIVQLQCRCIVRRHLWKELWEPKQNKKIACGNLQWF